MTELEVLCEDCHSDNHDTRERIQRAIGQMGPDALSRLVGYAEATAAMEDPHNICAIENYEEACGIIDALQWQMKPGELIDLRPEQMDGFWIDKMRKKFT